MKYVLILLLCIAGSASAQETRPSLSFFAADPEHIDLEDSARRMWRTDGARIIKEMERTTGLRFQDRTITVIMRPKPASSGKGGNPATPLRLDIRYPIAMSLTHELGHRLSHQLTKLPDELRTGNSGLDGHKLLYLFLYDVWVKLYGKETSDQWREIERGWANLGFEFIKSAWDWSTALGEEGRANKLRQIVAANRSQPSNRRPR